MSQVPLPLAPQAVPKPRELDAGLLVHCRNWREAVRVGIRHSYYVATEGDLAARLNMDAGTLSNILNKRGKRARYFDMDRIPELEGILGNRCVTQFLELQARRLLVSSEMSIEDKARAYDDMVRRAG